MFFIDEDFTNLSSGLIKVDPLTSLSFYWNLPTSKQSKLCTVSKSVNITCEMVKNQQGKYIVGIPIKTKWIIT